jgi:hypothetical protein
MKLRHIAQIIAQGVRRIIPLMTQMIGELLDEIVHARIAQKTILT